MPASQKASLMPLRHKEPIGSLLVAGTSQRSVPQTVELTACRPIPKGSRQWSGGVTKPLSPLCLVPVDTFASKVAALQDQWADASIGNVTGSNAVNVFLGLGVAWSVAAVYWAVQGRPFEVRAGTLAFSVTLFTVFAFVGIAVLLYRRRPHIGGELGGPRGPKLATTALFLGLWFLYILFSSLEAYCHIRGF